MSLDLGKTALQIERMTDELRGRQNDRQRRLVKAIRETEAFDSGAYEEKRARSRSAFNFLPSPGVNSPPSATYEPHPPRPPSDFCVAAVDGSHIDVDRHLPVKCCLINIGSCVLTYGSTPNATLMNRPRLYASEDELRIRSRGAPYQEQAVQGATLGVLRAVEEIRGLVDAVRDLPPDLPTLALMDGTLIMFLGRGTPDFVVEELVQRGFVRALDELRTLASERKLALASYISLPASSEFMSALRISACPYPVSDCGQRCGRLSAGARPCDDVAEGIFDREVFRSLLAEGERSAVFTSSNPLVQNWYGGHGVSFYYLNVGEEMGRVEIPTWVAEDETLLGLTHSLILDQCRRGPGYPISLMESHEQAVITTSDRRYFAELVEDSLQDQKMPVYTSEKNRSKRLRWL